MIRNSQFFAVRQQPTFDFAQLALGRNEPKQRLRCELVKPISQRAIAQWVD